MVSGHYTPEGYTADLMSVARPERFICWAMLVGLGGCTRVTPPPPFGSASSAPFLSFLDPQGPVAAAQRAHLIHVVLLLLIVVVPVLVLVPIVARRYRLNGSARYMPRWSFSGPLEFVVWGVPIFVVIVLGLWLHQNTTELDPYAPLTSGAGPPLGVEVVGYDWKWLFIYPQFNIASIGEFAFPADRPLDISLTSDTVMQSFLIPALGSQIYAMPGMVTKLHLLANGPGSFRGENTQFNGTGFYEQDFTAKAMTPSDFQAWAKRVQAAGIPLSEKAYDMVRQRSTLEQTREALGSRGAKRAPPISSDTSWRLRSHSSLLGLFTGRRWHRRDFILRSAGSRLSRRSSISAASCISIPRGRTWTTFTCSCFQAFFCSSWSAARSGSCRTSQRECSEAVAARGSGQLGG
jgi:cytochrome o ubiquinol oxidase subunit II